MHSFYEATAVKAIDSHRYSVDLQDDWTIGSVPNGGYVTACFMKVTQLHFATTLADRDQPHTLSLHLEFLRRTSVGQAIFTVTEKKLGGATSVVHVSLVQDGNREEVEGYITHSNFSKFQGLSLDTRWTLGAPIMYPVDLARLKSQGEDTHWIQASDCFPKFRKSTSRYDMFVPRAGREMNSVVDEWLRLRSGERFTDVTIGSVADTFPLVVEGFKGEIRKQKGLSPSDEDPAFWYPTLSLNIEIKKSLPEEGVEWLFVRTRTRQIKDGRNDLEIVILDDNGDLIALSHHVAMILDASRNQAKRSKQRGPLPGSTKI